MNRINTSGDIGKSLQDFSNIITLGSIVPDLCFRARLQNARQLQKALMFGTHFRSPNAVVPHDSDDFISLPAPRRARGNSNTLTGYTSSWLGSFTTLAPITLRERLKIAGSETCLLYSFESAPGLDWSWGLEILLRFLYLHADSEIITPKTKKVHHAH